jgi:hypothetical protein
MPWQRPNLVRSQSSMITQWRRTVFEGLELGFGVRVVNDYQQYITSFISISDPLTRVPITEPELTPRFEFGS